MGACFYIVRVQAPDIRRSNPRMKHAGVFYIPGRRIRTLHFSENFGTVSLIFRTFHPVYPSNPCKRFR